MKAIEKDKLPVKIVIEKCCRGKRNRREKGGSRKMILASNSPRRKEILENFGFSLKTVSKNLDEISSKEEIKDRIMDIAQQKTMAAAKGYPDGNGCGSQIRLL